MGAKLVRNIAIGIAIYVVIALTLVKHYWPKPTDPAEMSWEQRQEFNQREIAKLELGIDKQALLLLLGPPDIKDAKLTNHGSIELMFYRTHHREADGETTRDECTPILLKNGQLVGLGDQALEMFSHQQTSRSDEKRA